jgi:phosphopantothenoylcysteine decarboxylase / phosphopantothenate---cysteine ligase
MGGSLVPRRPWRGRRVVLGVTGGIAAYKAVQLARDLTQLGSAVDVIMTTAARAFVGPMSFEALTGRPVHHDIHAAGGALEHIRLAREADVVCVAPATADLLARAAGGRADDLLAAVLLATKAPVLLCPAMNDGMYAHPQTQRNLGHLRDVLGYRIVGPASGPLAFGEGVGPGRMEEPAVIVEHVGRALEGAGPLSGLRVVVTAGPTREPVDGVRVLSNRSSGRMGFALAAAAWRRGADVRLISGPATAPLPIGPDLTAVETAAEMGDALSDALRDADVLIMAAAVADFRPAAPPPGKIRKERAPSAIAVEPAPDLLTETLPHRRPGLFTVGFALETDDARASALRKLEAKRLDMIVLNEANAPGAGFEVETNRVLILDRGGSATELPLLPKYEVAEAILDRILQGRLNAR